jgi:hypothetical protein
MANLIKAYVENFSQELIINLDLVRFISELQYDYDDYGISNTTAPTYECYFVYFVYLGDQTDNALKIRDDNFPREQFIRQWSGKPLYDSKFLEGCVVLDWEFE